MVGYGMMVKLLYSPSILNNNEKLIFRIFISLDSEDLNTPKA